MADLQAGSRIAGYQLEEQIGHGGMAVVFRALDERLGRPVALKIPSPSLTADETFRRRFIRESQAAAAVDDPHIIPVFEAGEASGVLFIAMRLVRGGDVHTLLQQGGPLTPGQAAAVISPVASALDAAHATGLVHRDVKPANMLLDVRPGRPDHVYLSDFGLSRGPLASAGLTGSGQFLGSLDYVAPEQIEGKEVDGRADQYALACSAFEMLCGVPPFRRDAGVAVMYAQLSDPVPSLAPHAPGLPRAVDDVFGRAMAKQPADRYATCQEFADAVRAVLGIHPYASSAMASGPANHPATEVVRLSGLRTQRHNIRHATSPEASARRSQRWTRYSPRVLVPAAAVIAAAIVLAVFLLQPGSASPRPKTGSNAPAQAAAVTPATTTRAGTKRLRPPAAVRTKLLVGNVSATFPTGAPGKVALVSQGDLPSPIPAGGVSVPIAVRNNTSRPVTNIKAQGLVHSSSGAPEATGSDQGFYPPRILPGQVALGFVFLDDGSKAPAGSVMTVRVSADPSPTPASYETGLAIPELNNTGQQIVGVIRNPGQHSVTGPYSVDAFCLSKSGNLQSVAESFADSDGRLRGFAKTSFTIDLTGGSCPRYLVGASGFDEAALNN